MDINITGRNIDLDDSIKDYIHRRMDKLGKLYRRIYRCEVILEEEKERKNAEVILYLKRNRIIAKESSPDIYASIDNAAASIKKQVRRLNGRLGARRRKAMVNRIINPMASFRGSKEMNVPEGSGRVISTNTFADKPMLPEEAKLELEVMDKNFIVFKNADTGAVNVLYKRGDGNYGLVEPTF